MRAFIIRRILISLVILFGVSVILYTLVRSMPVDYIDTLFSESKDVNAEQVANLKRLYGLDTGILEGYAKWAGKALRGDLGESFIYQKPVTAVIWDKMWISFALAFSAFVFQLLIGIPLGIISATKQYSKIDYTVTVLALLGISLPSFFFAAILQRTFAVQLQWFPLQGMTTARLALEGLPLAADMAYHFALPVIVFVVTGVGALMRYSRTNMLEVMNTDYIRTARAKGLDEHTVIYKHAFRNTLIPIVTMVGATLPTLFSGAIITEGIFAIDGIGYTALNALTKGDIPFLMGFNLFLSILTLIGNLLSDILYAAVDPRVRYG